MKESGEYLGDVRERETQCRKTYRLSLKWNRIILCIILWSELILSFYKRGHFVSHIYKCVCHGLKELRIEGEPQPQQRLELQNKLYISVLFSVFHH